MRATGVCLLLEVVTMQRVLRYLNSYGVAQTLAAVRAYARRRIYAAAIPVAAAD